MVSTRAQALKGTRSRAKRPISILITPTSPPSKRKCHGLDSLKASARPQWCYLEELPTELLQQIFFTALNGNLLKASPRVAVKLSGSDAVRQAAFFLCFYSPDIAKIRDHFEFRGILSDVCVPVPFWELRSMTRAVLNSSWCKWGWVKNFLYGLLTNVVCRFERDYTSNVDEETIHCLRRICQHREKEITDLAITELHGKGPSGEQVGIGINLFDISINSYPDECGDDVFDFLYDTDTWTEFDIFRLRCNAFGSKQLKAGQLNDYYLDDTPFSEIVGRALNIRDPEPTKPTLDLWERHESQMMDAAKCGREKELRDILQLDYFFYPEDAPYRISPRLFRAAAKADVGDSEIDWKGRNLHVLFDIDPFSLPRGDRALKQWASFAASRCRSHKRGMRRLKRQLAAWPVESSLLSSLKKKALKKEMRQEEYWHNRDVAMLRYIRYGVLDFHPDLLSPRLAGQISGPGTESDCLAKSTGQVKQEANGITPNGPDGSTGSEDGSLTDDVTWLVDERETEYPSDWEFENETDWNAESEDSEGDFFESDDELESLYDFHERIGRHDPYCFAEPDRESDEGESSDELESESEEDYQVRVQQHEAQKQEDYWMDVTDWVSYEAAKKPEGELVLWINEKQYQWYQPP
jgi:hypothetical protein